MKCSEIFEELNSLMPLELAMDFDNPGLLLGRSDKNVKKVLVALDITSDVVEDAINEKVDLIVTHHPMFFEEFKQINDYTYQGKLAIKLLRHDISVISMHTNYDIAPGCMADIAATRIGLDGFPLEITAEIDGELVGIGKAGVIEEEMSIVELADFVKEAFDLENVVVYGGELIDKTNKIAICPGSGKGMSDYAIEYGCDVLITGDITHHEAIAAVENGLCVIDAGHYGIEKIFIDDMAKILYNISDYKLDITTDFATYKGIVR